MTLLCTFYGSHIRTGGGELPGVGTVSLEWRTLEEKRTEVVIRSRLDWTVYDCLQWRSLEVMSVTAHS